VTHGDERIRAALREIGDAYIAARADPVSRAATRVRDAQRRRRIIRFGALGAAAALVVGAAFVGARVLPQREVAPTPMERDDSPTRDGPAAEIPVGGPPISLAVTDDGSLWVGLAEKSSIVALDGASGGRQSSLRTRFPAALLATDGRTVFYGNPEVNEVSQVEPDPVTASGYGYPATAMAAGGGRLVFSAGPGMGTGCGEGSCVHSVGLSRSGLTSDELVFAVGCCPISAVAVDDMYVWAAGGDGRGAGVVRTWLDGEEKHRVGLPEAPTDLALDGDTLWAALPKAKSVARITSIRDDRPRVQMMRTDVAVSRLAVGDRFVFGAGTDGVVVKVPRDGVGLCSVVANIGGELRDIAVVDGFVYVAATSRDAVVRLDEPH
jgi:hypothetical protein